MTQLPLVFDRSKYRADFAAWLLENQHIWLRFCAECDKLWNRGRRHYSARTVIEFLRHETALAEVSGEFKVNNNWAPDMARLYVETYPERSGFFETRVMPGSARAA